jgi:hypothetical protein
MYNQVSQTSEEMTDFHISKMEVIFYLENLEEASLNSVFTNVSRIYSQKYLWPPLILVYLSEQNVQDPFQALKTFFSNNESMKNGSSWNFPINSDLYIIFHNKTLLTLEFIEIYTIHSNVLIQKVKMGNSRGAIDFYKILEKDERRSNFQEIPIVAVGMV